MALLHALGRVCKFVPGCKNLDRIGPCCFLVTLNNVYHNFYLTDMCSLLSRGGFVAVVDMAWGGWIKGRKAAAEMGIPYIR